MNIYIIWREWVGAMDVIDVGDVEDEHHSRWVDAMGFKTIRDLSVY